MKKNLHLFLLILILAFGAYLRFNNLPNRISLGADSARDAFVTLEGANSVQFPLIGPFTSVAPVVSSPWYWIQLIIAKGILGTGYAPWILIAIYSFLTIVVMYKSGVLLGGRLLGLTVSLATALSPQLISDATGLNNHAVVTFFASLVMYLFLKLLIQGPKTYLAILFGLMIGITISTHYQAIGLLTLPLSLIFFKKKYIKTLGISFIFMVITLLPLLTFELLNHWYNTRHIIQYLLVDQYKIYVPKRWLTYTSDYWPSYLAFSLGGEKIKGLIVMLGIAIYFFIKIIRRKITAPYLILLPSFLIQVIMVRYYRGESYFGYLKFLLPYIFIFTGTIMFEIIRTKHLKIVGAVLIALYIYTSVPASLTQMTPEGLTTETIDLYQEIENKVGPGPYRLFKCTYANEPKIEALLLLLYLYQQYDPHGKTLAYHWGCWYPTVVYKDEIIDISPGDKRDKELEELLFPPVNYAVKDFSMATEGALLKAGWIEVTGPSIYQRSARWWMDEQP